MNKKMVIIATITLFIDQIIKAIIELNNVHINVISGFFALNYSQNTGAAFSILQERVPLLIIISLIMLIIIYSMSFSYEETKLTNISFGILFGGVLGNLLDRIFCGYVRDYLEFNIFGYHMPIFNLADTMIVIGVILLIFLTFKGEVKNGNKGLRRRGKSKN